MLAAKALPGNPYDGHTLSTVIPHLESIIGNEIERIIADKGYRGHGAPAPYDMRVFVSEQKRGVTPSDQARAQATIGCRARHRPPEERPPHGPQLS